MHFIPHASRLMIGLLVCMALCGTYSNIYASSAGAATAAELFQQTPQRGSLLTAAKVFSQAKTELKDSYKDDFTDSSADKELYEADVSYGWSIAHMTDPGYPRVADELCRNMTHLLSDSSSEDYATGDEIGNQLAASMHVTVDHFKRYSHRALTYLAQKYDPRFVRERIYKLFGLPTNTDFDITADHDSMQRLVRAFAGTAALCRTTHATAKTDNLFSAVTLTEVKVIFDNLDPTVVTTITEFLKKHDKAVRKQLLLFMPQESLLNLRYMDDLRVKYETHAQLFQMDFLEEEIKDANLRRKDAKPIFLEISTSTPLSPPSPPAQIGRDGRATSEPQAKDSLVVITTLIKTFKSKVLKKANAEPISAADLLMSRDRIATFQRALADAGFTLGERQIEAARILMILRKQQLLTFAFEDFNALVGALRIGFSTTESGSRPQTYSVELMTLSSSNDNEASDDDSSAAAEGKNAAAAMASAAATTPETGTPRGESMGTIASGVPELGDTAAATPDTGTPMGGPTGAATIASVPELGSSAAGSSAAGSAGASNHKKPKKPKASTAAPPSHRTPSAAAPSGGSHDSVNRDRRHRTPSEQDRLLPHGPRKQPSVNSSNDGEEGSDSGCCSSCVML